jgi:O-antigen/teichoic acid export membrane protein
LAIPLMLIDPRIEWLALALAVRSVPSTVLVRRHAQTTLFGALRRGRVPEIIAFGIPGLGTAALVLLEGLVPFIALRDPSELGFAMSAAAIVGYPAMLQTVVNRISFPAFARLAEDHKSLGANVDRASTLTVFALISTIVPTAGLAPLWVPAVLGSTWAAAASPIALIGLGYIMAAVLSINSGALYALGHPADVFRSLAIATAIYLTLALVAEGTAEQVAGAYVVSRLIGMTLMRFELARRGSRTRIAGLLLAIGGAVAVTTGLFVGSDQGAWSIVLVTAITACAVWLVWVSRNLALIRSIGRLALVAAGSGRGAAFAPRP